MLSFLQGNLVEACPQFLVIQVGGLGLKVNIPPSLYFDLPGPGAEITVHTAFLLKDDEAVIYGFRSPLERDFFKLLIKVSGIGPKVSLALLGHLSLHHLVKALEMEDIASLSVVPGIGQKTAKRLIYELKEKVTTFYKDNHSSVPAEEADLWATLEAALLGLGYSQSEIARARKLLGKEKDSVEAIFKKALHILSRE